MYDQTNTNKIQAENRDVNKPALHAEHSKANFSHKINL